MRSCARASVRHEHKYLKNNFKSVFLLYLLLDIYPRLTSNIQTADEMFWSSRHRLKKVIYFTSLALMQFLFPTFHIIIK